jgi:hypothetical protein
MLINIFSFRLKIINTPTIDAKQKDGALHMVGSPADVFLKKKIFKDQVESLLSTYVSPEFQRTQGNHHLLVLPNPLILLPRSEFQAILALDLVGYYTHLPTSK